MKTGGNTLKTGGIRQPIGGMTNKSGGIHIPVCSKTSIKKEEVPQPLLFDI
ncbi:hypothetical protein ABES03_06545 [Neobacillus rhizosphaerae]|uniref:hypothetical protein n=1 Tax=Neobacillus rhizosphaerae TaxID=2880965 RepID=UPI003D2C31B5